jgi:hypothetical protein
MIRRCRCERIGKYALRHCKNTFWTVSVNYAEQTVLVFASERRSLVAQQTSWSNRRINKSQQMRRLRRGADLLLQVRCAATTAHSVPDF